MSKKDVERFKEQTKDLEEKGYFINQDGTKSTDMEFDPKGKNVLMPKKIITAFLCFGSENFSKVAKEHKITHV